MVNDHGQNAAATPDFMLPNSARRRTVEPYHGYGHFFVCTLLLTDAEPMTLASMARLIATIRSPGRATIPLTPNAEQELRVPCPAS